MGSASSIKVKLQSQKYLKLPTKTLKQQFQLLSDIKKPNIRIGVYLTLLDVNELSEMAKWR